MTRFDFAAATLMAFAWLFAPCAARAAESNDNCTGFITSLPAVITTPGTWCLKNHLSTAISGVTAIEIKADDVTLDCNNFRIGSLAASGAGYQGIYALSRFHVTVRHCLIRGFKTGLYLQSGRSHLVEDNRFDGNSIAAMEVDADDSRIRRNQVINSGAYGIYANFSSDIIDNTVSGHGGTGINTDLNLYGSIAGNRVIGVARGIYSSRSERLILRDNNVVGDSSGSSIGLYCGNSNSRAMGNVINGFATGLVNCGNDGNVVAP